MLSMILIAIFEFKVRLFAILNAATRPMKTDYQNNLLDNFSTYTGTTTNITINVMNDGNTYFTRISTFLYDHRFGIIVGVGVGVGVGVWYWWKWYSADSNIGDFASDTSSISSELEVTDIFDEIFPSTQDIDVHEYQNQYDNIWDQLRMGNIDEETAASGMLDILTALDKINDSFRSTETIGLYNEVLEALGSIGL